MMQSISFDQITKALAFSQVKTFSKLHHFGTITAQKWQLAPERNYLYALMTPLRFYLILTYTQSQRELYHYSSNCLSFHTILNFLLCLSHQVNSYFIASALY